MVPADSDGISPVPPYSGYCYDHQPYRYGAITPCGLPSQIVPVQLIVNIAVLQPPTSRNCLGLGSSPFARHYLGNHCCFLLLRVLRCFSSPGSPPDKSGYHDFIVVGCPIRTSADQPVFASPRSLSQLITSFFAFESQGILHTPFSTFFLHQRLTFYPLLPYFL